MAEDPSDARPAPPEDFATMFAAAEKSAPRGRRPKVAVGDRVRGKVASIGNEVTVLEREAGGEGTLDTLELRDDAGQPAVATGDVLEARVVGLGDKAGF